MKVVPALLSLVHGFVGQAQQEGKFGTVFGVPRDSDACPDIDGIVLYFNRLLHDFGNIPRNLRRFDRAVFPSDEEREFVTAHPGNGI